LADATGRTSELVSLQDRISRWLWGLLSGRLTLDGIAQETRHVASLTTCTTGIIFRGI
jgi:hypothetical protein